MAYVARAFSLTLTCRIYTTLALVTLAGEALASANRVGHFSLCGVLLGLRGSLTGMISFYGFSRAPLVAMGVTWGRWRHPSLARALRGREGENKQRECELGENDPLCP
jgi:hypothetical protein